MHKLRNGKKKEGSLPRHYAKAYGLVPKVVMHRGKGSENYLKFHYILFG